MKINEKIFFSFRCGSSKDFITFVLFEKFRKILKKTPVMKLISSKDVDLQLY